ncbi:major facilitator superfamily protein [Sarocladium implicatum]|nr:major facilitator superfamily protein [Sarocladium implicatum]
MPPQKAAPPAARPDRPSETTPLLNAGNLAPQADTEASALLTSPVPQDSHSASDQQDASSSSSPSTPLPKFQLALVCWARIAEPIAFFSIFPFIAKMVQQNGHLPSSDVGFYSGLIESLFSLTQMFVLIGWGRLADRIGRKPVLIASLAGLSVAPVLFCLSTSLWEMILFRCIAGIFSGSGLLVRTIIAEISTKDNQALAYGWFAFVQNIGLFIGPLIGGVLADPADQYPGVFGGIRFFENYPYFLAGVVPGLLSASSAILCAIFLKETLDTSKSKPSANGNADQPSSNAANGNNDNDSEQLSMWELIRSPNVGIVLFSYGHVMFLAFAFTALVPVVLYTPVKIGGLGFPPTWIAIFMAVNGASQALWLLLAFPRLHKRFGVKGVMWGCAVIWPWEFLCYIVLNYLLRDGSQSAVVWFWILAGFVAIVGPGISMAFTSTQLALNDVVPTTHVLGTLNAIAMTMSSAIRAVIPGVITVVYAVGVRSQILGGHLAWVILAPIAGALLFVVKAMPADKPPARGHNGSA